MPNAKRACGQVVRGLVAIHNPEAGDTRGEVDNDGTESTYRNEAQREIEDGHDRKGQNIVVELRRSARFVDRYRVEEL
jgi:hypothetical protein